MAAIICDGKRTVSKGVNSYKTHPLQARFGKNEHAVHLHAEIAALVDADEKVEGMTMYIARVWRDGRPALAAPCVGCQRALIAFGITNVVWTT